jgi:20S proteasome alpha/beta subunit
VTIAVGFKCKDGLVLATDTQYTRGIYKSHGPKLFDLFSAEPLPNLSVVVAGAGRVSFMKMAIAELEERLRLIPDPSFADVKNAVTHTLLDVFQTHIYPMPDYKQDGAAFELILGVWTRRDGFGLFQTESTSVNQELLGSGYCSIGTGVALAGYALDLTYNPWVTQVENAKFLAAFCIKAAKDYVGSCGGKTKIYTLQNNPSGFRSYHCLTDEVDEAEQYSEELFRTLKHLLVCLDPEGLVFADYMVGNSTKILTNSILAFRQRQREIREKVRRLRTAGVAAAAKRKTTPPSS